MESHDPRPPKEHDPDRATATPASYQSQESQKTLAEPEPKNGKTEEPESEKITEAPPSEKSFVKPPSEKALEEPPSEKPQVEQPPRSKTQRIRGYLLSDVSTNHADVLFLACCFISGLVDSTIYDAFGTFVSMQTGNTVFVGLGGATPHNTSKPYGWAKSLVSIFCFCLGCLVFSHTTRLLGNRRRLVIVGSFLWQTLIILIAAAVVQGGSVDGAIDTISDDINWWEVIPIALLSFQASGQIVGSRAVGLVEVPTVVVTSMLHDIWSDPKLLAGPTKNIKRNRRICAFFLTLAGAICGGFIGEGTKRMQVPLWIAGGIKLCITLLWMIWPEQKAKKT